MPERNENTKEPQRPKIQSGYQVGLLTVREGTSQRKNGYTVWRCECECGGEIFLDTRCLQRCTVLDCGCSGKVKPFQKDLTNQQFGKLVAKEPTDLRSSDGSVIWRCECNCGNECLAAASQLTKNYKKSCGCLGHPPLKDFIGKRFGKLTVSAYAGKRAGMHRWRCLCDCGKETVVGQTLLQTDKTRSCGCISLETLRDNLKLIDGTSVALLEASKKKVRTNNTSGYTGVYKKGNGWSAQIRFKGKTYCLGTFADLEDAVAARKKGERMHDEFLEWYYNEFLPNKR